MIGLFFSQVILFAAAALIGFAVGWRLYVFLASERRRTDARDVEQLRGALSDAQVRRARIS
jgi:hypothetical protein